MLAKSAPGTFPACRAGAESEGKMNEQKPDAKFTQWLWYGAALILLMAFPPRFLGPSKLCPFCRSKVAAAAMVCPHCQGEIDIAEEMAIREDLAIRKGNRRALAALGAFAVFVLCCVAVFLTLKAPINPDFRKSFARFTF